MNLQIGDKFTVLNKYNMYHGVYSYWDTGEILEIFNITNEENNDYITVKGNNKASGSYPIQKFIRYVKQKHFRKIHEQKTTR